MFCSGEDRHIHTDFGDERNSHHRSTGETGDGTNQLQPAEIRVCEPKDFGFNMFSVFAELVDVLQALFELRSLFSGYRPVNSSLYLINRVLAPSINERRNVKMLTGMIQNMLNDGT